jgi:hypothetical protein
VAVLLYIYHTNTGEITMALIIEDGGTFPNGDTVEIAFDDEIGLWDVSYYVETKQGTDWDRWQFEDEDTAKELFDMVICDELSDNQFSILAKQMGGK